MDSDSVYYVAKVGFVVGLNVEFWRSRKLALYDRHATVKEIGNAVKNGRLFNTSNLKLINEI